MPVTVVVGGQFGSEGKGKVAHYLAKEMNASVAIRCGGPNSGHTVIDPNGNPIIFQQLPTASILPDISIVLCAGMYIDLEILFREIEIANLPSDRLFIDPNAVIITPEIKESEKRYKLIGAIGSTGSGTGEAVIRRIKRNNALLFAKNDPSISSYVKDTKELLRNQLDNGNRVILEGTQGYGLSLLHSPYYPYVTSRDTTSSGFLSEVGLSPLDVDDVVLTIRAFPIRVAGNSGPFDLEISWDYITTEGKHKYSIQETTSVTKLVRRVAKFSPSIVQKAILANQPTKIVLNHIDYLCSSTADNYAEIINKFINKVETSINRNIDYLGFGPEFLKKNIKKMSTEKPPNKDVNTYVKNKNDAGMFSATQIAYYIENYGIIQNYDKACYGSASYHMRIGGEVLTWDGGVKTEFTLDQDEDRNKNKYTNVELKPNSLTFVTTIEKFNLPKDIICRFNLKSKWVHQGLLLGTGPIVDPQLNAYLLIPLHNFSSKTIRINYADELISVEFTKTLNPDEAYSSPDGSVYKFIENPNWHYDFKGYRKRIENKIIESSVLSTFHSLKSDFKSYKDSIDSQIKETENITKELSLKSEKELDRFRTINWVGLIGTILGVTVLVFTTWQLIENAHEKVDSAHNLVKQYDKQGVDFSTFALKSSIEEIQHEFQELKKYTERMNTESYINSSKVTVDIENLKKSVNDRITSLEKHIEAQ